MNQHTHGRRYYLSDIPLEEAVQSYHAALEESDAIKPLSSETVSLDKGRGRVTAEPIWAKISSPHYDSAAMDGVAVRAQDTVGAMETAPIRLKLGEQAIWVDTGDPVPDEFDAVIMVEVVHEVDKTTIEIHSPVDATGLTYIKIKKTKAGEGLAAGKKLASIIPIYKIVIVVDEDVDILDEKQVHMALGSRWQPYTASYIFEEARGMPLDPSTVERYKSSKIVIDATKQWPEEGGPENYAELNRALLEELAPESFDRVEANWGDIVRRKLTTF